MPKQKQFLNAKRKIEQGNKNRGPETANEFLAAGVRFEEAGEKWRAGDAAKSSRFFVRATETYDAGLQRFPQSADLAYNKARLQYEVCQQPRLVANLHTSLIDLLQIALKSHRFALKIDQNNSDLLFNTAQVLTSIVENLGDGKALVENFRDEALRLYQEAFELFQRCLTVQEFRYTQAQENIAPGEASISDANHADEATTSSNAFNATAEEVWASIEESTTKDTLLDTAIAQLETLTAICTLGTSYVDGGLAWVEEYYRTKLNDTIAFYLSGTSRQHEAALAKAKFVAAISEAAFKGGALNASTYETELNAAFTSPDLDLTDDPQALCDRADAYLSFNASVQIALQQAQLIELPQIGSTCWKQITKALDSLTAASKLPNAENLPQMHLRRGDCELLRLHLGEAPLRYDLAIKSAPTLLSNSGVYFRGAATLAKRKGGADDERKEAEVKEAIALALADDSEKLTSLTKSQRDLVGMTMEEMSDEGLLGEQSLQKLGWLFM
ncbi:hypothetical protein N7G274_000419 [Stereocaulon virgatum]|uniref:TPR-like protein n=1 Tax=Stereocaulon virgatum TaxID=373712 RepID=A0ABR4AS31_9LECA